MSDTHLVTGGSGYFGSLLVQRLHEAGHAVRVFDLNDSSDRPADVEFVQGDIRDRDTVERACDGVAVVHHNVAQVPLAKDRDAFRSVNYDGTVNLLEAAARAGTRKVVHMSTSAVFGVPRTNPVTEGTPPRPREAYGRAKLDAEDACHRAVAEGLDVTIIRPRTILGHGRLGIFQILFEWIRQGKRIPVLGRGDNVYQFVHADDLAAAAILAAERPGATTYNIGAERFGTMRQTLESLAEYAGTGSRVISVPMAPTVAAMKVTSVLGLSPLGAYHHLMYGRSMYFDVAKAKRELGWSARYGNEEMFRSSYDWYLAHRDEVLGGGEHRSHHRSGVDFGVLAWLERLL